MTSRTAVLAVVLFVTVTARAQEPESKAAESRPQAKSIAEVADAEYREAQNAFFKEYRLAKTDEEKDQLYKEKYPKPSAWFPKLYAAAKADPKGKTAEQALGWIVTHAHRGDEGAEALEILRRDHVESKDLAPLVDALVFVNPPKSDEFLLAVEKENPNREVKGRAVFTRAERNMHALDRAERVQAAKDERERHEAEEDFEPAELERLRAVDVPKGRKEVEDLFVRVQKEFADVEASYGGTLGDRAGGNLFEMRELAIGKAAPEIAGVGVDSRPLKLSDFKGKVVVLDFWGHW